MGSMPAAAPDMALAGAVRALVRRGNPGELRTEGTAIAPASSLPAHPYVTADTGNTTSMLDSALVATFIRTTARMRGGRGSGVCRRCARLGSPGGTAEPRSRCRIWIGDRRD